MIKHRTAALTNLCGELGRRNTKSNVCVISYFVRCRSYRTSSSSLLLSSLKLTDTQVYRPSARSFSNAVRELLRTYFSNTEHHHPLRHQSPLYSTHMSSFNAVMMQGLTRKGDALIWDRPRSVFHECSSVYKDKTPHSSALMARFGVPGSWWSSKP